MAEHEPSEGPRKEADAERREGGSAAVPYMKKSYHSSADPTAEANTTRMRPLCAGVALAAIASTFAIIPPE